MPPQGAFKPVSSSTPTYSAYTSGLAHSGSGASGPGPVGGMDRGGGRGRGGGQQEIDGSEESSNENLNAVSSHHHNGGNGPVEFGLHELGYVLKV